MGQKTAPPLNFALEKIMIFIPHNVPSLKNSKKPITLPGKKHTTLVHSDSVKKYLHAIGVKSYKTRLNKKQKANGVPKVQEYVKRPNLFRLAVGDYFKNVRYPVTVKFHFVRKTKADFDFTNAVDIIADLLTAHDFIEDDCMRLFVPMPMFSNGLPYSVNPQNPGVYLKKVEV